jgi:hypothetical protein
MHASPPHAVLMPDRRLPALAFSVAVHAGALLALAVGFERAPRGESLEPLRSVGIVLKPMSADGALYESDEPPADEMEPLPTPELPDPVVVRPDTVVAAVSGESRRQVTAAGAPADRTPSTLPRSSAADGVRGSPNSTDQYAKVSLFGVQGTGSKFVYLFDRSASMEGPPLAAAKRQLIESLKSLDNLHQFQVIFFNHRLRSFDITSGGRRIPFGTDRNKQLAANFVGGITADGGTDRFIALKQALAYRPDVIFFLTDADDPMSASEMKEVERIQSRLGTAICVIEFGRTAEPPKRNFLTDLARLSGGQYGYVNTAKLKP